MKAGRRGNDFRVGILSRPNQKRDELASRGRQASVARYAPGLIHRAKALRDGGVGGGGLQPRPGGLGSPTKILDIGDEDVNEVKVLVGVR
jgi:hypothetical protein